MTIDWPPEFCRLPDDSAIVKADARPCTRCAQEMVMVKTELGLRVQCPSYVRRKPDHRVIGTIDAETWTVRPISRSAGARV